VKISADIKDRLWGRVIIQPDGCALWTGAVQSSGYGHMSVGEGRIQYVHRISYSISHGEIPPGFVVDHICSNRLCVAPGHLEAVSLAENNRRTWARGRGVNVNIGEARRKDVCPQGHPKNGENLYVTRTGAHQCKECRRQHQAKMRHKKRVGLPPYS
jgi:hypothetical protein